jgi:hypothetical protein
VRSKRNISEEHLAKPRDSSILLMRGQNCAGISKQSMGASNRVKIGLSYRPARLSGSLESIHGLLERLKFRSLVLVTFHPLSKAKETFFK